MERVEAEEIKEYFPFWGDLSENQREALLRGVQRRTYHRGQTLHDGSGDCIGLILTVKGQLRVFTVSEDGKEITLYRLLERDMCLFSASCMMKGIQFEVMVEAEQESTVLHIPAEAYKKLMKESAPVANYTSELMAVRFSEVMWLVDQILNKKMDTRLAGLLAEESRLTGSRELHITHEQLAHHLGSAREVVTRMLKYFQKEQMVSLTRGSILLTDIKKIEEMAEGSRRS